MDTNEAQLRVDAALKQALPREHHSGLSDHIDARVFESPENSKEFEVVIHAPGQFQIEARRVIRDALRPYTVVFPTTI